MVLVLDPIENGESGLSVREKLNQIIAAAADGTLGGVTMEQILALFDKIPPAVPTGLAISYNVETGKLIFGWNNNTETDFAYYDLWVQIDGGSWQNFKTSERYWEMSAGSNLPVVARVRAFDIANNHSDFCPPESEITGVDLIPPATPINVVAVASYESILVRWDEATEADFRQYHIYESDNEAPAPNSATQPTYKTRDAFLPRTGLGPNVTKHYWVRAEDTSGNTSTWSARASATTQGIELEKDISRVGREVREVTDEARRLAESIMDALHDDFEDRQLVRQEVSAATGAARSYVDLSILAATGPDSAIAQAFLDVYAAIDDMAESDAFLLLVSRVDDLEDGYESLSEAVLGVEARVDDVSAGGAFRARAAASPGGGWSRTELVAWVTQDDITAEAMLYADARIVGGEPESRIGAASDQFVIFDPSTGAAVSPIIFSGGVAHLNGIVVDWALIENAVIDWADIGTLIVENLIVEDGMIPAGLITNADDDHKTGSVVTAGDANVWVDIAEITIQSPSGISVFLYTAATLTRTIPTGGVDRGFGIRVIRNSTVLRNIGGNLASSATLTLPGELRMDAAGVGTFTYKIQMLKANLDSGYSYDATIIGQCAKK